MDPEIFRRAIIDETRAPTTTGGILKLFDNPSLAMLISGTRDKKSNAYKAALRNVQRYRQGTRHPTRRTMQRLRDVVKEARVKDTAKRIRERGIRVSNLVADLRVSRDTRRRDVSDIELDDRDADAIADAIEAGEWERAAEYFEAGFAEAYGMPDTTEIESIDVIELDI